MRKLYYTLVICFFLTACKKSKDKEQTFQAMGTLTGLDMAMCACCGGIKLEIDNDQQPYSIQKLGTQTWDQMTQMDFPKRISFNYTLLSGCAIYTLIEITDYEIH